MLLTSDSLKPLAVFAAAVVAWQQQQQAQAAATAAANSARAAAQAQASASVSSASTGATSPPTTTTTAQGASTASGPVWSCIIAHESGGNPSIYNESGSGASGLYQIMPGTWGGYDGYANAADAPASVQTARAEQLQAEAGWSPWAGDGCTPVG